MGPKKQRSPFVAVCRNREQSACYGADQGEKHLNTEEQLSELMAVAFVVSLHTQVFYDVTNKEKEGKCRSGIIHRATNREQIPLPVGIHCWKIPIGQIPQSHNHVREARAKEILIKLLPIPLIAHEVYYRQNGQD